MAGLLILASALFASTGTFRVFAAARSGVTLSAPAVTRNFLLFAGLGVAGFLGAAYRLWKRWQITGPESPVPVKAGIGGFLLGLLVPLAIAFGRDVGNLLGR